MPVIAKELVRINGVRIDSVLKKCEVGFELMYLTRRAVEIDPTEKKEKSGDFERFLRFFKFPQIHFRFFFEPKDSNYRKRTFSRI